MSEWERERKIMERMQRDKKRRKRPIRDYEDAEYIETVFVDEDPFDETPADIFNEGVRAMDVDMIRQALAAGADPYQKIYDRNVDDVVYPNQYMITLMTRNQEPPNLNMWTRFKDSVKLIIAARPADDERDVFYKDFLRVASLLNFVVPLEVFEPQWADEIFFLPVPRSQKENFWTRYVLAFHTTSDMLRTLNRASLLGSTDVLSNYPVHAVRKIVFGLLAQHDTLSDEKVRFLCNIEPEPNYERQFTALQKMLQGLASRKGLFTLADMPYRYWMSLVMAYLYGVTSMQNNEFGIMIPYVIETRVIPVAGHLERVKFLPDFDQVLLDETLETLRHRLADIAQKCHNDPRVRLGILEEIQMRE
jgi:hypothetical protein